MKQLKFLFAWIVVSVSIQVSAQENDLRLEVEAGVFAGKTFVADVYIRNTGHSLLNIPVGEIVETAFSEGLVVLVADVRKTYSGEFVKPTPRQLDVVALRPNELVKLYTMSVPYRINETLDIHFVYKVSKDLAAFYDVWTGVAEVQFHQNPRSQQVNPTSQPTHGENPRAK